MKSCAIKKLRIMEKKNQFSVSACVMVLCSLNARSMRIKLINTNDNYVRVNVNIHSWA